MLRWLGPRKAQHRSDVIVQVHHNEEVTDDPLAAIDPGKHAQQIYAVSRSVTIF